MTCPDRQRHLVLKLWVTLVLLSCSSVAWAEGANGPHSLIQHPPATSSVKRLAPSQSQAQSSPYPIVPHTLLKKPTPPSSPLAPTGAAHPSSSLQAGASASMFQPVPITIAPTTAAGPSPDTSVGRSAAPLAPTGAVPPSSSPQVGASASLSQPVPSGMTFPSEARPSPDTSVGRSAAPLASAAVSPRTETSRLPGPLQRLFRENPAFIKLLQVAPTPPPPTPPAPNSAILTWRPNRESDLAGYKIYVGTSSGTYNFPGSPFRVDKVATYTVTNLQQKTTYFFAISAYDIAGNESPLSNEASKSIF